MSVPLEAAADASAADGAVDAAVTDAAAEAAADAAADGAVVAPDEQAASASAAIAPNAATRVVDR
jgi:hypothetical protein